MRLSTASLLMASAVNSFHAVSAFGVDDDCESALTPLKLHCSKFVVEQNGNQFAVRMPDYVTIGNATILRPYNDKRQASSTQTAIVVALPSSSASPSASADTVVVVLSPSSTPSTSTSAPPSTSASTTVSTAVVYVSPIATTTCVATSVITPVNTVHLSNTPIPISWKTVTSPLPSHSTSTSTTTLTILPIVTMRAANPEAIPGGSKEPKKIEGRGADGKKFKLPNKKGEKEWCDDRKGCKVFPAHGGEPVSCIKDLEHTIMQLSLANSNATFGTDQTIACSPGLTGPLCAYLQYIPFTPVKNKGLNKLQAMVAGTQYPDMEYNRVPLGAIAQAMEWIVGTGAKTCGNAIVPVPKDFGSCEGCVYVLSVQPEINWARSEPNETQSMTRR